MVGDLEFWRAMHLFALGAWAGLVGGEIVIELASYKVERLRYAVARYHHLIDRFVEIPLLIAVVGTGLKLISLVPVITAFLWAKIALGLGAVIVNLVCVVFVVVRGRTAETDLGSDVIDRMTRLVFATVIFGVPMALAALAMGGRQVGWW